MVETNKQRLIVGPSLVERPQVAWRTARRALLALALAMAFLQYYFLDVYAQIAALPHMTVIESPSAR